MARRYRVGEKRTAACPACGQEVVIDTTRPPDHGIAWQLPCGDAVTGPDLEGREWPWPKD